MTIAEPITVVSGLPRSGTSLMMQMLAAGGVPILTDAQRAPDEDNPRGYFELQAVKHTTQDASWLRDAPGKAVKIIHVLLKDLSAAQSYQVIFMRRPRHSCDSWCKFTPGWIRSRTFAQSRLSIMRACGSLSRWPHRCSRFWDASLI
jgi:hypothetical protein